MEKGLLTELLVCQQDGLQADSEWKPLVWNRLIRKIEVIYTEHVKSISIEKIQTKNCQFKKLYNDWKTLRSQSEFGWDKETRMIIVSNEV